MPPLGSHEHGSYWGEWMAAFVSAGKFNRLTLPFLSISSEVWLFCSRGMLHYWHLLCSIITCLWLGKREHPFYVRSVFQEQNWYHRYYDCTNIEKVFSENSCKRHFSIACSHDPLECDAFIKDSMFEQLRAIKTNINTIYFAQFFTRVMLHGWLV